MVTSISRFAFLKYANDLQRLVGKKPLGARHLVWAVLFAWQQRCYPELVAGHAPPAASARLVLKEEVKSFVEWLSAQQFNEGAYWLATAYAFWVGEDVRSREALFFTPPAVAERVIDRLVEAGASLTSHDWHDPACGGAAFLVPIAQRMASHLAKQDTSPRETLQNIERHLSGTDLDVTLLGLSHQFLSMALYELISLTGYSPTFALSQANGLLLEDHLRKTADIYICNPPYRKMGAIEAAKYQPRYGAVIEGQPNLYAFFIYDLILRGATDCLIGILTPTSYLSGQYFSKLRAKIAQATQVLQIDMLSDRRAVFMHVEQETSIAILKPKAESSTSLTSIAVLTKNGNFVPVGTCTLPSFGEPWSIPRDIDHVELLKGAQKSPHRLADYGYKPRIGSLVGYRDTRKRYTKAPKQTRGVYPLIWATDFSTDGIFEHGRKANPKRIHRYVKLGISENTGLISKPAVLLQRLTSNDQLRRLVAAPIPDEWVEKNGPYIAENHVIVLEQIEDKGWKPEAMANLLNSNAINHIYRASSGASNVSVYELAHMPLPCPVTALAGLNNSISIDAVLTRAFLEDVQGKSL